MLEPTEHDPVVNPALGLKLSRHRIVLPRVDDLADVTLSGLLDAVRAAVAAQGGWLVSESVALSSFSSMNGPVYRDLLDNEDLVAAHPAVRALALGLTGAGRADEIGGRATGASPPPAVPPLILDADSAQRACITTALAGRSFTIDGPPGTGKSQTIANMIGALLHAGKTVLLVSEKAAALDVVRDRLAGAGLGRYLLELHSHKAARKEVAVSLASALDEMPAAQAHAAPPVDADLFGSRDQLNSYAHAVNRVRDPLGYSLHDVLAMIGSLHAAPAAPVTGLAPVRLTPEVLAEVRRAAAGLAATWRPAAQGRSFAWRGVIERGSLEGQLYQAASALEALGRVVRANQILADATGLTRPSDAHALARLLDHLLTWPESMPDEWLTVDTLDVVDAAVAQLSAGLTAIAARETQASQAAGIPWRTIPRDDQLPTADAAALTGLSPPCADVGALAAGQVIRVAQEFSAAADLLEKSLGTMSELARILGVHSPATFTDANDLLTLARLAAEPDRPERAWLSVPSQRAASDAAQVLYDAHRALATAEADARAYFTADALRHDAGGLAQRFAAEYHRLGRLSAAYRADKKTVEAFTREGVAEETAQEHLGLAAAWKHAAEALAAAEARYAPLLGPHYAGQATDFARLDRALTHAATAVRCARGQDLSRAAGYISRDAALNGTVAGIVAEARRDLSAWQAALAPAPAIGPRPELLNGTITEAIGWLRAHLRPLHVASAFTEVVGEAVGRALTFGQARQIVALRRAAESAHAQLTARDAIFRDLCGQLYDGATTDVMALQEALEWARCLRTMISGGPGPLTPAHLDAAESAVPTDRLAKAADAWQEACVTLLAAFSPHRRQELAAELDDYQTGDDLLETMFNDVSGQDEWHAYQAAQASLAAYGMAPSIDFCVAERVEPAQAPRVIERALLQEWADYQLRADPALAPLRSMGPGALVDGCRRLDGALTAAAADDIVRACTARAPRDAGESAVIRREAAKKSTHMPVRELLGQACRLTQAIKPCFLMSPPAVSQYLPPGMRFDVVIFDEASQVSPADAINCIYRGSALILAGDDKQLTPANPAHGILDDNKERSPDIGEPAEPDSVFDLAKTAGPFGNRTLRWHYRSRHESLIAYSNAAFYDGRLVLVPGGGPEAGIELFYGMGTYRRETSRDNPEEAARVAQRVIHHYDSRPALSLGVVTFSESQANAIEAALAKAREQRPDLDRYFTGDRLRGFFVKNAESVQGDERDVLILSVGYGPDENGQVSMDFGALSRQGGWRRLNVATTRARYRTEIVSSIRGSDIPESVTSEGLLHLRRYLTYCGGSNSPANKDR
ncbi:MAG TPA: ATP-binding protein [Streptosporangiaceae bacterium]|nr:ATP-binding protein [Streptosporangiaceae bacterium]